MKYIPEFYLILSILIYWIGSGIVFLPVAIVFLLAVILQLILKKSWTGMIISATFVATNLYLTPLLIIELMSLHRELGEFDAAVKFMLCRSSLHDAEYIDGNENVF